MVSMRSRTVQSLSLGFLLCSHLIPASLFANEVARANVRLGILSAGSAPQLPQDRDPFRERLRSLGYVEGRNVHVEARWANGDLTRLDELANDLVARNVDVIVAATTYDVRAAKKASSNIPIVMVTSADPVATGLVADLARPDGNVTGLSLMTIELTAKRLQILKDAVPRASRIAVLWNPDHPFHARVVEGVKAFAPSLSIEPTFVSAHTREQFPVAITAAKRARADALCVIEDPFFYVNRATIARLASKERLPAIYGARDYVEAGGLMSYGPNYEDSWRRAAEYVDKILQGAKPSDLPIEQPTKFELLVNLRVAKEIDLKVSESVLVQATEVIR
jgi:putative ABC transport system substrate-binding protein